MYNPVWIRSYVGHLPESEQKALKALITKFISLFQMFQGEHYFDVYVGGAPPIKQHPYRVDPVKLMYIHKEMEYMSDNRIIESSRSQWSLLCVLVPKSDSSYRLYTDFHQIDAVTKTDPFLIPLIDNCIDRIRYRSNVMSHSLAILPRVK